MNLPRGNSFYISLEVSTWWVDVADWRYRLKTRLTTWFGFARACGLLVLCFWFFDVVFLARLMVDFVQICEWWWIHNACGLRQGADVGSAVQDSRGLPSWLLWFAFRVSCGKVTFCSAPDAGTSGFQHWTTLHRRYMSVLWMKCCFHGGCCFRRAVGVEWLTCGFEHRCVVVGVILADCDGCPVHDYVFSVVGGGEVWWRHWISRGIMVAGGMVARVQNLQVVLGDRRWWYAMMWLVHIFEWRLMIWWVLIGQFIEWRIHRLSLSDRRGES